MIPWTAAHQASLSITNSRSLPKLMSIKSVMPSNHLLLCRPLLFLLSVFPSIRVFSNELAFCNRWSKYWGFSFSISSSNVCIYIYIYIYIYIFAVVVVVVKSPSRVHLFVTPWTAAHQASLSLLIPRSLPEFMFIASVMLCSHLII